MDIMKIINEELTNLSNQKYNVGYICSFGSHNYGLELNSEDYTSDLDLVAIIIPTLDNMIESNRYINFKYTYEYGEVNVKDIRLFVDEILKGSPTAIECLFAKYGYSSKNISTLINSKDIIVKNVEAKYFNSLYNMFMAQEGKIFKQTTSSKNYELIEKFGYDGKKSSLCLRISGMIDKYFNDCNALSECFSCDESEISKFLEHKTQKALLEDVEKDIAEAKRVIENNKNLYFDNCNVDSNLDLISFCKDLIKDGIMSKIRETL